MRVRLLFGVAVTLISFGFRLEAAPARAAATRFVFIPAYQRLEARTYTGSQVSGRINMIRPNGTLYFAGYGEMERTFGGDVTIKDQTSFFGSTFRMSSSSYLETEARVAPSARILPRYALSITPHQIWGADDWSLGFSFSRYEKLDAGTLHPAYIHSFSDAFSAGTGVFVTRASSTLTSAQLFAIYRPSFRHSFRADLAGGRGMEDAGVEANFNVESFEYGLHYQHLSTYFNVGQTWSQIRNETSFGLRLEIK